MQAHPLMILKTEVPYRSKYVGNSSINRSDSSCISIDPDLKNGSLENDMAPFGKRSPCIERYIPMYVITGREDWER